MSQTGDKTMPSRRSKRLRKESSSEISIEELSPDDMGYDADVEALQPDQYEEADSEPEETSTPKKKFPSIDEELSARMKHLGKNTSGTNSPYDGNSMRGRKRRIVHQNSNSDQLGHGHAPTSELEVMEILDRSAISPPAKRRRKRSRPGSLNCKSDSSRRPISRDATVISATVRSRSRDAMDMS
ncbi:hypothetical protein H2198_005281 [Neophaeococcomyces mojaviensis]|uniref:Uncharacterized protein n=1 Tax=Neophaeococcomyces mojaviensis TaxID=3383035 RepID=A0ACC3A652_9EURO|nr:hypothetical protein H2198_005281 [Knufia sp. JES_112]